MTALDLGTWLVVGGFIVVIGYVLARVMSFAYFRTKSEHIRSLLRDMNRDDGK